MPRRGGTGQAMNDGQNQSVGTAHRALGLCQSRGRHAHAMASEHSEPRVSIPIMILQGVAAGGSDWPTFKTTFVLHCHIEARMAGWALLRPPHGNGQFV